MIPGTRCPRCNHSPTVHYRDGTCPRWANARLDAGLRVIVRLGTPRWEDCAGHTLVFFADALDKGTGMLPVWDLSSGRTFDAPSLVLNKGKGWTIPPSVDQRLDAKEDVEREIGERVNVVKGLV